MNHKQYPLLRSSILMFLFSLVYTYSFAQVTMFQNGCNMLSVNPWATVEILPLNASVQNDSVTLHWTVKINGLSVKRNYSHVITPILVGQQHTLTGQQHSLTLPSVLISGHKRASYDKRERTLDQFRSKPYTISIYKRGKPIEPIYYSITFPYAAWMEHCALDLRQARETTWESVLLSTDRLCNHLHTQIGFTHKEAEEIVVSDIIDTTVTVPTVTAPTVTIPTANIKSADTVANRTISSNLTLFYPQGYAGIEPFFLNNNESLLRLDSLFFNLLDKPNIRIHKVSVVGYSSPDGNYNDNEYLASRRAEAFTNYLCSLYDLPYYTTVRTSWVAEDWVGLSDYLKKSTLPYRTWALSIIKHVGIFDGRERDIMDINGGDFYKEIKQTIFPKLRRIELLIEYEAID